MLSLANGGGADYVQVRFTRDGAVFGKADKMWPTLIGYSDNGHGNISLLQPEIHCPVSPK